MTFWERKSKMKKKNNKTIIGVDHGYGYTKGTHTILKSGVDKLIIEPPFNDDLLVFQGKVYAVGQKRGQMQTEKTKTIDYYILTLATIASEMKQAKKTRLNDVVIAAGLPYSFMSSQGPAFQKYLGKNKKVDFKYEGVKYSIGISGVKLFPQGFPMIAYELSEDKEEVKVADIGSRTIDVLTFINGKPIYDKCFSLDRKGTLDCVDMIEKYFLTKFSETISENKIQDLLQNKKVNLPAEQIKFVKELIRNYVDEILMELEVRGIKNNVVYCGGGATVVKNYHGNLPAGCIIKDDIYANAKGYEELAADML